MSSNSNRKRDRETSRLDSIRESQKRSVFVDEFGGENPAVAIGRCKPATKGVLAIPLKEEIAAEIIDDLDDALRLAFTTAFRKLETKHNRTIALQAFDSQLAEIAGVKLMEAMESKLTQLHDWYGE